MSEYKAPIGVLTLVRVLAVVFAPLYLIFTISVALEEPDEDEEDKDSADARHLTMSFGLALCWIGAIIAMVNYGYLVAEFWNGLPKFYHSAVFFIPGIGLAAHGFANRPTEEVSN